MGASARNVPARAARTSSPTSWSISVVHQVDLGQRHQAAADAHQREDVQVLAGLGHHAVVGGDDEDHHVDAVGPGDHVADEVHVAGHVHDADDPLVAHAAGGEAQVDGQARAASPRPGGRCRSR